MYVPQRVAQNDIWLFLPAKFNFCRKQSATKYLYIKTFSGKVEVTSFLYSMVYRWIAGDVSIYLKFAPKVTHLSRKRWFRQISLNSAAAVRASENVQLSLIGNRQRAFHRAINEPCALPLSLQKSGSKWNFTFGVAFHFINFFRCR